MMKIIYQIAAQRIGTLTLAVLFTALTFNWAVPTHFDADTVLQSIMSMQKVTLFYWGQDRYANFLPLIFSWIPSPTINLLAIYCTAGLSFFLLLELISDTVAKLSGQEVGLFRLIIFLFLVVVSILTLNRKGIYTFAFAAQPYSLSFLLMGWTWLIALKEKKTNSSIVAMFLMMLVALGLNPSIMLITWMIFFLVLSVQRNFKLIVVPILGVGLFFFWHFLSQNVNAPHESYSQFNLSSNLVDGIVASIKNFSEETERLVITIILLFSALIANLFARKSNSNFKKIKKLLIFLGLFGIFWWCLFVMSAWATRNNFHFRYFFPTILTFVIFISASFTCASYAAIKNSPKIYQFLVFGLLLTICILIVRPIIPIKFWHSSGGYDDVGQYLDAKQARILTGGYWQVWPALFRIQSITHHRHQDGYVKIYGATYRGNVNKAEMDSLIIREERQGKLSTAVCVGAEPKQCQSELEQNTSFKWTYVELGQCGITKCHLLRVTN